LTCATTANADAIFLLLSAINGQHGTLIVSAYSCYLCVLAYVLVYQPHQPLKRTLNIVYNKYEYNLIIQYFTGIKKSVKHTIICH